MTRPHVPINRELTVHAPSDYCQTVHCAFHNVDEPDGEYGCGECLHAFPTAADLVRDHNVTAAKYDLPTATTPEEVWVCPHCAHDL